MKSKRVNKIELKVVDKDDVNGRMQIFLPTLPIGNSTKYFEIKEDILDGIERLEVIVKQSKRHDEESENESHRTENKSAG